MLEWGSIIAIYEPTRLLRKQKERIIDRVTPIMRQQDHYGRAWGGGIEFDTTGGVPTSAR